MANKIQLNLSGGMNVQTSPLIIKDNECELALNYNLDVIGSLTKRGGTSRFSNPTAPALSANPINGLYQFNDSSAGVGIPLMVKDVTSNATIYYMSGGLWTASDKTNDTASKRTRFSTFVDYAFRVNGADVVATSANGANWGTTNAPITIIPAYTAVFQDRVYVANGVTSNRSRFWFSSLPNAGSITWTIATDWVDVNPDDGDVITALENNGNRLLIFKTYSLYRWTFGQVEPDRLIGVGTQSQESVKTNFDVGITFFANPLGIYAYTSGRPKLISRKIQKYIDAVSNWTNVFGDVDRDHYYLSVGNLTVDGRTFSNCVLVYNIPLDAWTIYTMGLPITFMARLLGVFGNSFTNCIGSTDGKTYIFTRGTLTVDDVVAVSGGVPIPAEFISKEYLLEFPNRTNFTWLDVFSQARIGALILYDLDRQNNFTPLEALSDRVSNFRIPSRECNTVRVKVTEMGDQGSTANAPLHSIEGFNMEHHPKEKRDERAVQIRRKQNNG